MFEAIGLLSSYVVMAAVALSLMINAIVMIVMLVLIIDGWVDLHALWKKLKHRKRRKKVRRIK